LKNHDKTHNYLSFYDKTKRHYLVLDGKREDFFDRGERAPPKIATFCYCQILLCHKKPIFRLFCLPDYRGARGNK
jgi:hypothetical protein